MICCRDDKIDQSGQSGMSDLDFDLIDTNHMSQRHTKQLESSDVSFVAELVFLCVFISEHSGVFSVLQFYFNPSVDFPYKAIALIYFWRSMSW